MSARITRRACLVACLALAAVLAAPVTASGAVMSTGYGGWLWRNQHPQGNSIRDVKAIGSERAWAVGDAGTILKTTDGGRSWKRKTSGVMKDLTGVDFADSTHGWAVGGSTGAGGAVVLRTTDGGATWVNILGLPMPANVKPVYVDFVDRRTGWIGCTGGQVYKSTDYGLTWQQQSVPLTLDVSCLKFISTQTGWVCSRGDFEVGGTILKTTDGGATWHEFAWTPWLGDDGECVQSMTFASHDVGWFGTSEGRLFKTGDRGKHWSVKSTQNGDYGIMDLNFASTSTGWMTITDGPLRTTNGGATWKKPSHSVPHAEYLARFSSSRVVALGSGGYTYRTSTGGKSWARIGSGVASDFVDVSFGDALHGWILGTGMLLRTTDGGATRSRQTIPDGVSWPMGISATSPSVAWTCGYGNILRTTNSGVTWSIVYDGIPWTYAISAVDDQHAISVGEEGHVLWTADGGVTWHDVTTGVDPLRHVEMASASVAYATGDDGVILRTGNGGASWASRSVSSAYTLTSIEFITENEGWVAGIVSGRPAILHTTNGGLNWNVQPAGMESGGLSSIKFLDAAHGLAVGDTDGFGITMSTTDGGTTWTRSWSGTGTLFECAYESADRQVVGGVNALLSRDPN